MRTRTARAAAIATVAVTLAAGSLAAGGQAAAGTGFYPSVMDLTLSPGHSWGPASGADGIPDGTVVYAFSKKPLTDTTWSGGGLPSGLTVSASTEGCKVYAGVPGIFTCPVTEDNVFDEPTVTAGTTAANDTTAYVGVAYAARGASITTAVKAAQIAATTNTDPQQQTAAVIKVKTAAQLAKSNVQITAPDVPLSTSTVQTVHVHAEDPGRLVVSFWRPQGERDWDLEEVDIKVTSVDGGPGSTCDHTLDSIGASGDVVRCDLPVGDHTVTYTLTSGPNVAAWQIIADTEFQIVNYGVGNPEATHTFSVTSPYPVRERYRFLGRDTTGRMYYYDGTGNAAAPYRDRWGFEYNWKQYTATTALSALDVRSIGDVVARDASGVLWYYQGARDYDGSVFNARTKVGGGWNTYNTIVGTDDVTGDTKPDLVARDASGVLWLYKGTGSTSAPFAARTRIGAGWNTYTSITATGDLTGDGKPDLLGRDASGALWLYKGTGSAAAPYAARVKVGTGWNTYTAILGPGDLTSDGKPDLLGRDASGALWLYKGTGNVTAPYAPRTKIGTGWNTYNALI